MNKYINMLLVVLICLSCALSCLAGGSSQYSASDQHAATPGAQDPRSKFLESKMGIVKLSDVKMSDVVSHVKLGRKLGYSIMMRDGIADKRISIDFPGGTLAEFIGALCIAADARIAYEKFAVVFEPKRD